MRQPGSEPLSFSVVSGDLGPLSVRGHVEYILETESGTFDLFDVEIDEVLSEDRRDVSRLLHSEDWAELYRRAQTRAEALNIGGRRG